MREPSLPQADNEQLEDMGSAHDNAVSILGRALRTPLVWRALGALALAAAILVWPDRTERVLARLLGLGIGLYGLTLVVGLVQLRRRPSVRQALEALALLAVGFFMVVRPTGSLSVIAALVGTVVVLWALRSGWRSYRTSGPTRWWHVARSGVLVGAGLAAIALPGELIVTLVVALAVSVAFTSAIAAVQVIGGRAGSGHSIVDTPAVLRDWLLERPKSMEDRQLLYGKLLYEGAESQRRLTRFVALMVFASVIATTGVVTDSTAVVIGAMLIAPLMTPLMATALSLVMGWPIRLARAALIALLGVALTLAVSAFLAAALPAVIDVATNSQIQSRSAPTVLDLVIALAAGAAGAYALSRPDVSDSLPGVAIAISLVPPLAVVGVAMQQGAWGTASGAALLFTTNVIAIMVMGGLTFIATGVAPVQRVGQRQKRVRTSLAAIAVLGVVVVGALAINGTQIARDSLSSDEATETVRDWLADTPSFELIDVALDSADVRVVVAGPDALPDVSTLAAALSERLGRDINLDLRLRVEEQTTVSARR